MDLEYGLAFMEAMGEVLKANPPPKPFRYVQLSGMFVRQDQDAKLWFLSYPRKLKVRYVSDFATSLVIVSDIFVFRVGSISGHSNSPRKTRPGGKRRL